jgi:hypothetical protein
MSETDAERWLRGVKNEIETHPVADEYAESCERGIEALALIRERIDAQRGSCDDCGAYPGDQHAPRCWSGRARALLTRAGRAAQGEDQR